MQAPIDADIPAPEASVSGAEDHVGDVCVECKQFHEWIEAEMDLALELEGATLVSGVESKGENDG